MASCKKQIFVSHTSKDKVLVDKLVDLLTSGCAVDPNAILCTSLEGKGIPAGTPSFIEYLRNEIQTPRQVILVLSENFFESHFCVCELGAVWGMGLPNFPLVVPPLNKSELRATLAVTQAGHIMEASYLDELRDRIRDVIGTEVPTATWNVKRDAFLRALPKLLEKLPKPTSVSAKELEEAKSQYQAALEEVSKREEDIETLNARIVDLEKCKNKDQVRAVNQKYSKSDEVFEHLCEEAKKKLENVKAATCRAIYLSLRGDDYKPKSYESDDVREAEEVEEVTYDEDTGKVHIELFHTRVAGALAAVTALGDFLEQCSDVAFYERFEEEHKFPASITNKEFWSTCLVSV